MQPLHARASRRLDGGLLHKPRGSCGPWSARVLLGWEERLNGCRFGVPEPRSPSQSARLASNRWRRRMGRPAPCVAFHDCIEQAVGPRVKDRLHVLHHLVRVPLKLRQRVSTRRVATDTACKGGKAGGLVRRRSQHRSRWRADNLVAVAIGGLRARPCKRPGLKGAGRRWQQRRGLATPLALAKAAHHLVAAGHHIPGLPSVPKGALRP
mmetsp:Transcript_34832/g.96131  ORF Transcript_34832/g.96131 Transcript_34832/m.96131 type:complete len:209 (+) Transcript_34832:71-697(+)